MVGGCPGGSGDVEVRDVAVAGVVEVGVGDMGDGGEVCGSGGGTGCGEVLEDGVSGLEVVGDSNGCEVVHVLVGEGLVVDATGHRSHCRMPVNRSSTVEGQPVDDIVLDNGCYGETGRPFTTCPLQGRTIQIRCAHTHSPPYTWMLTRCKWRSQQPYHEHSPSGQMSPS